MSREPIYEERDRTDRRPQRNGESSFSFYNRIGGEYWEQGRRLQQEWADRLSDEHYVEIRAALRKGDAQARSAYLELYLHEVLTRSGNEVVVHPGVPNSPNHPDFLARRDATRVYVEAIAPGTSKEQEAAAARMGALLAAIDEVGDPNFMLVTEEIVQGKGSAPAATFRKLIRQWLAELDPDTVDRDHLPAQKWERSGWSVTIEAMPNPPDGRQAVDRSIGMYAHSEAELTNDGPRLVAALMNKDRKYGDLDAPFVIAVGTNAFDEEDEDVHNALYGTVAWQIGRREDGEVVTRGFRKRDGYFGWPGAWRNRHVSGVLIVDRLAMHDPTKARVALWKHPDPEHPLPDYLMFPGAVREWDRNPAAADVMSRRGLDARTLLALADDWPEGEPWDRRR
jgi:hypothetical protein